jgi:arginase
VDSVRGDEMPAAYAPSETGLTIDECHELLTSFKADPRTIAMEVKASSAIKDEDGSNARSLSSLLGAGISEGLKERKFQKGHEIIVLK